MPFEAYIWYDFILILALPNKNSLRLESLLLAATICARLQNCCSEDQINELSYCGFLLFDLSPSKKHVFDWLQSLLKWPNFLQLKYLLVLNVLRFLKIYSPPKFCLLYTIAKSPIIFVALAKNIYLVDCNFF